MSRPFVSPSSCSRAVRVVLPTNVSVLGRQRSTSPSRELPFGRIIRRPRRYAFFSPNALPPSLFPTPAFPWSTSFIAKSFFPSPPLGASAFLYPPTSLSRFLSFNKGGRKKKRAVSFLEIRVPFFFFLLVESLEFLWLSFFFRPQSEEQDLRIWL